VGSVIGSSVLGEGTNHLTGERKMKNEQIKEITSKAIDQLIAALNEGRSETLIAYLMAMAKFHRYSLRNIMLIAMQKPTATHVAGFHTWHNFSCALGFSWTLNCDENE
jgi:hypothetical protein